MGHLWAPPLKAFGAVLRTPLPPVCIRRQFTYPKTCSPRPSPPFVEVAARGNSGKEMGVKDAVNFCVGECGVNPSPPTHLFAVLVVVSLVP